MVPIHVGFTRNSDIVALVQKKTYVQLALAKKKFAYKFNSYVVGTERETKIFHLEPPSSNSLSRMQHGKISDKMMRQWRPSQLLLRIHFLKPHLPKMCDRLRTHYPIDWALRVDGVLIMKKTLITTKNHAEYAGIEYSCGAAKAVYRRYPLRTS